MNLSNYFNISRFWLLLKMELYRSRMGILWTIVIGLGLFPLFDTITLSIKDAYAHNDNYACGLIVGGFVLSSLAFNDLSNSLKSYRYLTLPASTFEKFLCMWLLTSVGWIVLFTIAFSIFALVVNPIGEMVFSFITFHAFDPFGLPVIQSVQYYVVLHGIFLVGAAHFRGYVFPKTLVTLILFAAVCVGIIWLLLSDVFLSDHVCTDTHCELVEETGAHRVWFIAKGLFWWLLAPLTWVMTYLGIKEKEV